MQELFIYVHSADVRKSGGNCLFTAPLLKILAQTVFLQHDSSKDMQELFIYVHTADVRKTCGNCLCTAPLLKIQAGITAWTISLSKFILNEYE